MFWELGVRAVVSVEKFRSVCCRGLDAYQYSTPQTYPQYQIPQVYLNVICVIIQTPTVCFVQGVGNTHTHTHTHTKKKKKTRSLHKQTTMVFISGQDSASSFIKFTVGASISTVISIPLPYSGLTDYEYVLLTHRYVIPSFASNVLRHDTYVWAYM